MIEVKIFRIPNMNAPMISIILNNKFMIILYLIHVSLNYPFHLYDFQFIKINPVDYPI